MFEAILGNWKDGSGSCGIVFGVVLGNWEDGSGSWGTVLGRPIFGEVLVLDSGRWLGKVGKGSSFSQKLHASCKVEFSPWMWGLGNRIEFQKRLYP